MKKVPLPEYFELETVEFEDPNTVGGRPRSSSHSWFRYYHEILPASRGPRRLTFLSISFATLLALVAVLLVTLAVLIGLVPNNKPIIEEQEQEQEVPWMAQQPYMSESPTSSDILSLKNEEAPTAYNALNLFEEGRYPKMGCNFQCCGGRWQPDPANKPFENRIDRSYCENAFDAKEWDLLEDIRNSEILRCYNITYRYCVLDIDADVPDNDVDKQHFVQDDCAYEFFEHGGSLYSVAGIPMPESFNAKCQDTLRSRTQYYLKPESGCAWDVPLRFCHCDGTIDVRFVTGDGPFNCNEFEIADTFKMGSMDDNGLEDYCERDRQKKCP